MGSTCSCTPLKSSLARQSHEQGSNKSLHGTALGKLVGNDGIIDWLGDAIILTFPQKEGTDMRLSITSLEDLEHNVDKSAVLDQRRRC